MKIAYLIQVNLDRESGVAKKVRDQVEAWLEMGHEVRLYALARVSEIWDGLKDLDIVVQAHNGGAGGFNSAKVITRQIIDWAPDVVYMRSGVMYPSLLRLARNTNVFLEVNTNEKTESSLSWSIAARLYHSLMSGVMYKLVCGMVSVSGEVGRRLAENGYNALVLGNGVDMRAVHESPPTSNTKPNLVFIGTPGFPWHGIAHVVELAYLFPEWIFHLVGFEAGDEECAAPGNVVFHGYQPYDVYRNIMAKCDIAIATLALYIKGMNETSSIKVREYLAVGLPVIIGHDDPDFPVAPPFMLKVPNTPSGCIDSARQINAFVQAWMNRRVSRSDVEFLDVRHKERERLNFITKSLDC